MSDSDSTSRMKDARSFWMWLEMRKIWSAFSQRLTHWAKRLLSLTSWPTSFGESNRSTLNIDFSKSGSIRRESDTLQTPNSPNKSDHSIVKLITGGLKASGLQRKRGRDTFRSIMPMGS